MSRTTIKNGVFFEILQKSKNGRKRILTQDLWESVALNESMDVHLTLIQTLYTFVVRKKIYLLPKVSYHDKFLSQKAMILR